MSNTKTVIETVKEIPYIDQAIANIITQFTSGINTASDFLKSEIPDVVSQLLMWNFCISLIWFSIGTILFITGATSVYRFCKRWDDLNRDKYGDVRFDVTQTSLLIYFICSLLPGIIFICANTIWLKIWIAPKLYLIEYVRTLM